MKTFLIKDIGEVSIRKSPRAKRISLRIKQGGRIEAVVPSWAPYKLGKAFAFKKKDWIIKQLRKTGSFSAKRMIFTENSDFTTRCHSLIISRHVYEKMTCQISDDSVKVKIPESYPIERPEIQDFVLRAIFTTLRIEAMEYLPGRVKMISEKFDLKYEKLKLKNQKTLWGSCSSKNIINLNINLMRLPDHLIDYVILHELVHTKHKNHGPDFWNTLNLYSGGAKKLAGELKNHSLQLLEPYSG